jgi:hypothetical protein
LKPGPGIQPVEQLTDPALHGTRMGTEMAGDRRIGQAGGEQPEQRGLVFRRTGLASRQLGIGVDRDRPRPHEFEQRDQRVQHRGRVDDQAGFGAAVHLERDQGQLVVGDEHLHRHVFRDPGLLACRDHRAHRGRAARQLETRRVVDAPVGHPGGEQLLLDRVRRRGGRDVGRPVEAPGLDAGSTL